MSPDASPAGSPTGVSACALTAGRWEPGELRGSRRVLRAPEGETPSGDSPDRALHVAAAGRSGVGPDRRADARGRARTAPGQDADRLLQGRSAPGNPRAHLVYLPRVRLPGTGGTHQRRPVFHRLSAGDQSRGTEGQKRRAPRDADSPAHRPDAQRPGALAEPHRRRVDQLLRPVLPVGAVPPPAARQRLLAALGWAEYKRLRTEKRYRKWLAGLLERQPGLFTHWRVAR